MPSMRQIIISIPQMFKAFDDIQMVANILLKQNVFDRSLGASQTPVKNADVTPDLYCSGMAEIWAGGVIHNYKDVMEKGGLYKDSEDDEVETDDDVVVYEKDDDTEDMILDDV